MESVTDTITVSDAFPVRDASVTIDVSHRRIGALVVSLSAQPPDAYGGSAVRRTVVLKERGLGRLGDNMYMTTFSDSATQSFPVDAVRQSSSKMASAPRTSGMDSANLASCLGVRYQITSQAFTDGCRILLPFAEVSCPPSVFLSCTTTPPLTPWWPLLAASKGTGC